MLLVSLQALQPAAECRQATRKRPAPGAFTADTCGFLVQTQVTSFKMQPKLKGTTTAVVAAASMLVLVMTCSYREKLQQ